MRLIDHFAAKLKSLTLEQTAVVIFYCEGVQEEVCRSVKQWEFYC